MQWVTRPSECVMLSQCKDTGNVSLNIILNYVKQKFIMNEVNFFFVENGKYLKKPKKHYYCGN